MLYKTIILEMIKQRTELHLRLVESRTLLPTVERFASLLKQSYLASLKQLRQKRPDSAELQLTSEAMELALEQIGMALPESWGSEPSAELCLDEAMQFVIDFKPLN